MTNFIVPKDLFTHLHLHTHYSLQDSIIKPKELFEFLKLNKFAACAITDHGSMAGIIDFYKEAKKVEIKPILGVEAYLTEDEDGLEKKDMTKDNFHCVMLAKNKNGLNRLIELTNHAYLDNFYYKPRISINHLTDNMDDVIVTSACLGGIISSLGIYDAEKKTFSDTENKILIEKIELFATLFPNRFYLEIQDNEMWEQKAYNKWLIKIAKEMQLPLVITTDAHFIAAKDFGIHQLMMAKSRNKTLKDYLDEENKAYSTSNSVRLQKDMYKAACSYNAEEAFWNTIKIADECNIEIKLGKHEFPAFDITQEKDYKEFLEWRKNEL